MIVKKHSPVVQSIPLHKEERSNAKLEIATGLMLFVCWVFLNVLYG
jgi:hypothetical protein